MIRLCFIYLDMFYSPKTKKKLPIPCIDLAVSLPVKDIATNLKFKI